jgi:hypothetical protein
MTPSAQLDQFIDRYPPAIAAVAREALGRVRKRLPGAVEMVYDNYNALVIGFGPTDRASEAIVSIALYPKWVNLFFLNGAMLPDPQKILTGRGSQVRRIRLDDPALVDSPPVRALFGAAVDEADTPFDRNKSRRLIIKSVSAKQRSRRPR